MTENFSNTYFSDKVCSKIGFVCESINNLKNDSKLNERESAILITSLLYAMDKIATACGHYDAYRKSAKFTDNLTLAMLLISGNLSDDNRCYNKDANELVQEIYADLIYIDPP